MSQAEGFIARNRVFPRIFSMFYLFAFWEVGDWFKDLPDPTAPQAAFASTVVASAAAWFKFYVDAGKQNG